MDLDAKVEQVQERIQRRIVGALRASTNPKNDPDVQACMKAYVDVVCRRRPEFMRAALKCEMYAAINFGEDSPNGPSLLEKEIKKGAVESLIVMTPARWEFQHAYAFGDISDVCCCVDRYDACTNFMGVAPLEPGDPWDCFCIPMMHKDTSPWYQRLKRRRELKAQLPRECRSLVNHAKGHTKEWFMRQWVTPPIPKEEQVKVVTKGGQVWYVRQAGEQRPDRLMPEISAEELLRYTGYTPEEFWRECKKPNTVKPHFPQLQFAL